MTFTDEPTWSVLLCIQGTGNWCETQTFQYSDTVTLCGTSYASLPTGFWTEDTMYVRNEGPRTLFRIGSICTDKEYLMYDFSLAVGDTVYAGLNLPTEIATDTAIFVLASIDTVTIQGVERRRFNMLFDRCNEPGKVPQSSMDWIEGLGSTMHPFYPLACICDFCESGYTLLCTDSAEVRVYMNAIYDTCTITTGIYKASAGDNDVVVYHDPIGKALVVRSRSGQELHGDGSMQLRLHGLDARLISSRSVFLGNENEWRIPISDPAPGVYFMQLQHAHETIVAGRVLIH